MRSRALVLSLVLALAVAVPALGGPFFSHPSKVASILALARKDTKKALQNAKAAKAIAEGGTTAASQAARTATEAKNAGQQAKGVLDTLPASLAAAKTATDSAEQIANAASTSAATKMGQEVAVRQVIESKESPTITANCPDNKVATGGGFTISGGEREAIPTLVGGFGLKQWIVIGTQVLSGHPNRWTIEAAGFCAAP